MTVQAFLDGLPFEPDRFQLDAVSAVDAGRSVVVTAPTGSGKTVIAEAAIARAVAGGGRAFYTAPIKALSNQKFGDLRSVYGDDGVGLLTGDNVVNGDAAVVVMTTEVLRNMIYADSPALDDVTTVVLDEVHYLQDPFRGLVWEEVIIHLPARIQLVSLSATIANAGEFTEWMRERRGAVDLISETRRPVPLDSHYMVFDRHRDRTELLPIFKDAGGKAKLNPQVTSLLRKGRGRHRRFAVPRRLEVVEHLNTLGLLPTIYFIFSRAGCDQAAQRVAAARTFTTDDEAQLIEAHAAARTAHLDTADLAALGYETWVDVLRRGVGAHHAGMVPAFKETVEDLFAGGYLKVVFATETLALGINMPARTVVIERLTKFTGETHELLQPGDYTQLTGRAGRRGIDDEGTAVVLYSPHVPFDKVAAIAATGSHPLRSGFQPTYNMAVNLIANYGRERAEELLGASFAEFAAARRRRGLDAETARQEADIAEARARAAAELGVDIDVLDETLAASSAIDASSLTFVQSLHPGDVIGTDQQRSVVLVRGYGTRPRLLLLDEEAGLRRVKPEDLAPGTSLQGTLTLPEPFQPREPIFQHDVAAELRAFRPETVSPDEAQTATESDVMAVKWAKRLDRRRREMTRVRRRAERAVGGIVDDFGRVLRLLDDWGYVDGWSLTAKGERLRFVYTELDLLMTESVERSLFDGLSPQELAAVVSGFVYEARSNDEPGDWPTAAVADVGKHLVAVSDELRGAEAAGRLPESRPIDPGFSEAAYYWAGGTQLMDLFEDEFAAGDFVRTCRQLLDVLRQLRDAFPSVARSAGEAIRAIDRGVVAAGGIE
ncbi:MAG: DEAD/DEAH box helicase [Acidimicrobiia bacterium]|nr:DEAD/DEAH box helicase [Acidimicrobiia bacterium]